MSTTWHNPFQLPRLPQAEFEKMKADYIAKYGYQVFVPGWEDFIHLPMRQSMTDDEEVRWHNKDFSSFTSERLQQLQDIKAARRRQYNRLLGSTQPRILRYRGSILVAIDNTQDTLSTLSFLIRWFVKPMSLAVTKLIEGPVGWIMTANDILNLCTHLMTPERSARSSKRMKDHLTVLNPFTKKARIQNKVKFYTKTISRGDIIEGLQTCDSVFGFGISLGAIMNLPFDAFFGLVRRLDGQKVTVVEPMFHPTSWAMQASLAWKSLTTLYTTEGIFTVVEALPLLIVSHLVSVAMNTVAPALDPRGMILDIETMRVDALKVIKPSLREVMEDAGDDPDKFDGWPITDEKSSSCITIASEGRKVATNNFRDWSYENQYNMQGIYGAMRATEASLYMASTVSENGKVEIDYNATEKITHALLNAGYRLPYNMSMPSGWWKDEKDIDYNDIVPEVRKLVENVPESINNLTLIVNSYSDQEKGLVLTPISPKTLSLWWYSGQYGRNITNTGEASRQSTIYSTWQTIMKVVPDFKQGTEEENQDVLLRHVIPGILEYLNTYDAGGMTPTIPAFLQFLKENYWIVLPLNTSTAD